MLLTVSNLSKTYPKTKKEVLKNISFAVNKGEFVSVIGPSGCGKSTLLSILAGVEKQTCGSFSLSERSESKGNSLRLRSDKNIFGYMPQRATLLPWMSVLENVALGLTVRNIFKKTREEKARKLLKHFQLDSVINHLPTTLSGGMSQRVALLRTILFNQEFLLLDEPFGALDALTRFSCQKWLREVWQEYKSTVIFVTHDISEAIFLSNKILVMNKNGGIIKEIIISLPQNQRGKNRNGKQYVELEKELFSLLMNKNAVSF